MGQLEQFLTDYYQGRSSSVFARGSTGLYVLFKALYEIKGVGEIIIPAICCETIPMAAIYAGMKPVIADVEVDSLCLSYESTLRKLTKNTVAIVLVYIFGNLFDPTPFYNLKIGNDLIIIEDIAQAVGGREETGQPVGQRFDFTLLSFANDKIIKGRAGAIIQHNPMDDYVLTSIAASLPPAPKPYILQRKELSLRNLVHALYDLSRTDPAIDISQQFQTMLLYYKDVFIRQGTGVDDDSIINQFQKLALEQKNRYTKYQLYRDNILNELVRVIEFAPGTMCWRLPLLGRDPVNTFHLTALLRRNGILASNHYFPLDKLLSNSQNPNAADVGSRIINLWVDDVVTIEQVHKTIELINSYRSVV